MNNNSFWDSYKAKCAEKGLPPHYESEEEFSKAMTQPSKPYSTDDLVAHKEEHMQDNDEFEGMYSLMQQLHRFVEEEYLEDFKENTKEKDMAQKVEWLRCIECNEMKEDTEFARLPNGKHRAICKKCMGDKIKNGHKKREELIDKGAICVPDRKPLPPVDPSCYAADAIALSLETTKEELPLLREPSEMMLSMRQSVFNDVVVMAFNMGKQELKTLELSEIHAKELAAQIVLKQIIKE